MTAWDQLVLLIAADAALKQELLGELVLRRPGQSLGAAGGQATRGRYQVSIAANLDEARERVRRGPAPAVIVLEETAFAGHTGAVRELAGVAPVVLILSPGRVGSLNGLAPLLVEGRVEVVARADGYVPLVTGLIERHARLREPEDRSGHEEFGEILRHEVNNPLTGILGNAELLLARREQFPAAAVQRLETIAELAVRLRETIRRLSNAWAAQAEPETSWKPTLRN
jgi:signal transduction histidine kinase